MAFKKGEVYRCSDVDCGCEIAITRGAQKNQAGHQHRCCCGREMDLSGPR
jgi:hypothetical protein